MSTNTWNLLEGVVVLLAIILFAHLLKRIGFLQKENSGLFSQLVLKVSLPALILSSLIQSEFNANYLKMAAIMAAIEIGIVFIAYLLARLFQFERAKTGAFILVSSFGMTAMLGYPLISEMFPNNALAMEEAVITSEFGVGLLLFVIGPLIAMFFGQKNIELKKLKASALSFFKSPVFIALMAGIFLSFVPFNENSAVYKSAITFLDHLANANLFLVAFTIGLILEFKNMGKILIFSSFVILLKLIIKPILAVYSTDLIDFSDMSAQIVFIETAMPSAILTAVFAKQYNCKPELVSATIMITLIVSVVSIPTLFAIFY